MKTRTYTKHVSDLTPQECRSLRRLRNPKGKTRIVEDLVIAQTHQGYDSRVVMVKELGTGKILSWGLIDRSEHPETFQIYTRKSHRRKGLGAKVVKHAKRIMGDTIRHFSHDTLSTAFYKAVNLKNPKVTQWLDA